MLPLHVGSPSEVCEAGGAGGVRGSGGTSEQATRELMFDWNTDGRPLLPRHLLRKIEKALFTCILAISLDKPHHCQAMQAVHISVNHPLPTPFSFAVKDAARKCLDALPSCCIHAGLLLTRLKTCVDIGHSACG